MQGCAWPPPSELLPHAGNMVLLSRVRSHDDATTVCEVEIDGLALFRDDEGNVPAWVGLELMAQCIGVHGGLVSSAEGEEGPRIGLLLGSRRVSFQTPEYHRGQTVVVSAKHTWGRTTGLVVFDCTIDDAATGDRLAEARLNCFMPADSAALEKLM